MIGACSINQVTLMGRLTSDPELRQTPAGVSTCSFTVAITRSFANQNGERQSDFISCTAWRQTAEFICRNFSKGRLILIEGSLRSRSYDDRNHPDVKHYVTEVFVDNVGFGETKSSAGQGGGYSGQSYNQGYSQSQGYGQNSDQGYQSRNQNSFQQNAYQQPQPPVSVGDLSDFEEVISDSDLPF
ncbi:MAG: single-stranded DNA-binding protein [Oscillospiraceae bacterium]|nr:single-stranded DNA-binding protein [Oscillospiraceae bacterium]